MFTELEIIKAGYNVFIWISWSLQILVHDLNNSLRLNDVVDQQNFGFESMLLMRKINPEISHSTLFQVVSLILAFMSTRVSLLEATGQDSNCTAGRLLQQNASLLYTSYQSVQVQLTFLLLHLSCFQGIINTIKIVPVSHARRAHIQTEAIL